ncbi:hypothetical protein (macronuclear) [Paramecium tetraurelia strain d4-2]|uniref:Uncharacterized protein n=1 Tax=Paramecium tetraurelia TaxID=5888 RepID=Q6BG56_PARTE|nr:hypothetical protein [Paramecium tetraurelia strain d4-2]CAH03364.1 hypothetical protein PTMB.167 [Paramecium tetraurelia]
MFIIFLIQALYSLKAENFLCGLRLFYDESTFFLIDQQNENTMPYILTSQSPHFGLDIQQSYKSSPSLNNNSYFLVGFSDAYIFAGDASEIQWISIQEFKVNQNRTNASIHKYNGYNGYFVDKGVDGGHLLISTENLVRDFSYGKTDAVDKFEKMGFIYIVSWGGKGDALLILKRFIHLIEESEGQEYCQQKVALISLEQIKCNLDQNFERLTFHTPDLYHPPIHYHLGNEIINGSLENKYFTKNYPGLQVFVAQNLNQEILELRIPLKNMEIHQQTIQYPLSGLVITLQQENRGFIHIVIFESDEETLIHYKEDENLAYITVGMTDSKVFVFSFVTSQFTKFPSMDLIEHVFQDCIFIIHQRNNVCENTQGQCADVSLNLFKQLQFELQSDQLVKFKSNGEYQQTPFVEMYENHTQISNEFNVLFSSEINNREMNHGGYIGSYLRVTYKHQSINSLIINEQNENLEVFYSINDNICNSIRYTLDFHSIRNITGKTYVLVFTSQNELTDIQCLQLFREFIDHIQKLFIIDQVENHCEAKQRYYDVTPIQYKEIHKLKKQPAELIQTADQDQFEQSDLEYSTNDDESCSTSLNTNSEELGLVSEASLIPDENHLETQKNENIRENENLTTQDPSQKGNFDNQNYKQQQQEISQQINNFENKQIYQSKREQLDQNEKSKLNQQNPSSKQKDLKSQLIKQLGSKMEKVSSQVKKTQNSQQNKVQETQTQGSEQVEEQELQMDQGEQYQKTFHQKEKGSSKNDQYYVMGNRYSNREHYNRDYGRREEYYGRRDNYYGRRGGDHYGRGDDYYGRDNNYYERDDYYGRDDHYDRHNSRRGPLLTGQSVTIPKNPNDQELGKFLREVISKLYIYSDPCDAKSTNYNPNNCEADNYYGSSSIKRSNPRQRDFYRSAYKYDNRYEYRGTLYHLSSLYHCLQQVLFQRGIFVTLWSPKEYSKILIIFIYSIYQSR